MSIATRIRRKLRARGRGAVFTPRDMLDLGSRAAVDQALSRLVKSGFVQRLTRGLYSYPRKSPRLGVLSPTPDAVAAALARQNDSSLQVTGAQAANALGLSLQVPAQTAYLTDGRSRRVKIGGRTISLKHASAGTMVAAGTRAGTIIQALRYLGADTAPTVVDTLSPRLSSRDRHALFQASVRVPAWLRPVVQRLAQPEAAS